MDVEGFASMAACMLRTLEARAEGFGLQMPGLHHMVVLATSGAMGNGGTKGHQEDEDEGTRHG